MNSLKPGKILIVTYVVLWIMSFVYYSVIISYSVTPANKSSNESQAISKRVTDTIDNIFRQDKLTKSKRKLRNGFVHHMIRKTAHATNFFIFSFITLMLFFVAGRRSAVRTMLSACIVGLCGGAIDECIQLLIEGRSGQFTDVIVDFTGTMLACCVFFFLVRKRVYFYNKKVIG